MDFQEGSDAIRMGGARRLQERPKRTKLDQLSAHLDDWCDCLQTNCADLLREPVTLKTMTIGHIPSELGDELLPKPYYRD